MIKYDKDKRIVMTLDAGGTNFVFSAIQAKEEIVEPVCLPSYSTDLERSLNAIREGFATVKKQLK